MASAPVVAAWGGGVNSTAMLIELLRLGEQVDLVLFADTKGEKPETYAFRDVFAAYWKDRSAAPFITVHYRGKWESLEAESLGSRTLPSKAYGYSRCSQKWKIAPQAAFVNNWEPAQQAWQSGEKVTKLIGFDAGERHRANKKQTDEHKYTQRYPLIEWEWDRDDCVAAIERAGLKSPGRSSCFFCPQMRKSEILELQRNHPDLLARALLIEASADRIPDDAPTLTREEYLATRTIKGLGKTWRWADFLKQEQHQGKLFPDFGDDMPCGCHDGTE